MVSFRYFFYLEGTATTKIVTMAVDLIFAI